MKRSEYITWLNKRIDSLTTPREKELYTRENIDFAIEEIEQLILNYCVIPRVPDALRFVWANMVVDLLRTRYPDTEDGGGVPSGTDPIITGVVKEIKDGDTTTIFDADAKSQTSGGYTHTPDMEDLIFNYRDQLKIFRRIY